MFCTDIAKFGYYRYILAHGGLNGHKINTENRSNSFSFYGERVESNENKSHIYHQY